MDVQSAWTAHFDESAWLAVKSVGLIFGVVFAGLFGDWWWCRRKD